MSLINVKNNTISEKLSPNITFADNQLTIAKNQVFEEPIKIVIHDQKYEELKILVKENTQVKIMLELANGAKDSNNYTFHFAAEQNTNVKYLLVSEVQSENASLDHYFSLKRDAKLELVGGFVSNKMVAKMSVDLLEEGAEVKMRAVAISSENHVQKVDVFITHKAPYTYGDMTNIGIASKNGQISLNGVEKIEAGMKQANAFQTLKGIITDDAAKIEVNPILLIDEYDVKAGHGATIGKIEESVLFYLRSRGLTLEEAERLVINGFLQPVIDEIEDEPLRERFVHLVNLRI